MKKLFLALFFLIGCLSQAQSEEFLILKKEYSITSSSAHGYMDTIDVDDDDGELATPTLFDFSEFQLLVFNSEFTFDYEYSVNYVLLPWPSGNAILPRGPPANS